MKAESYVRTSQYCKWCMTSFNRHSFSKPAQQHPFLESFRVFFHRTGGASLTSSCVVAAPALKIRNLSIRVIHHWLHHPLR